MLIKMSNSVPFYLTLVQLSMLLIFMALLGGVGGRPPECQWKLENAGVTASGGEQLSTTCHVRTLSTSLLTESGGNASLPALSQATHVTVLTLHCARQVVFESEITPGMFSVFPRLEDLQVLGCKVTELPPHAFAGLPYLRRFTLKAHHQDWPGAALAIHSDAFNDLTRLEYLNLAHNALWSLPHGVLCSLPSLISLNLTHNRLHHLPDLGLGAVKPKNEASDIPIECNLPLHHLDLSHNQIAEVPEQVFTSASDLYTLSLKHNRLAHLSDWAFGSLASLKLLDLSHNRLVAIPRSALADLQQLRELRLANNSLSVLPPAAFSNLGQLLTLDLSHNQLTLGPNNMEPFTGLIRLVVLDISYNHLVQLGPDTFKDLYSLQVLRLNNNQLNHLADATFSGLSNLYTLTLTNNKLSILSGKALQGLAVLTHLSLDSNVLEAVHENALNNCSSLHHLSLSNNHLQDFPMAIKGAPLLKTLDLSYNKISYLDEGCGLKHLQDLNLANNVITNVSRSFLSEIPSLALLDMSNNVLTDIGYGALEVTPNLKGLNLHHNSLGDINGLVTVLQNLTWLNVSHNSILWFDYALIPKNLEWIDLSYNLLVKLENYYGVEKKLGLKILYATHNNLTDISAAVVPDKIEEVHLEYNAISYVASNTFLDKTNVTLIDLRNNHLTILEESALRLSPRQTPPPLLLLSNNPLECDCGADWLLRAAGAGFGNSMSGGSILPHLGDVGVIQCRLPSLWHGVIVPLVFVQQQQFLCTYRRHCFTLCHCCDFDACDCEQTCPRNCTCYHDHTWTHNVVDCSGGWTHMPSGVPMDVTEAFMDGNNMGALTSHALIGRKNLRILHLNHSEITSIQNRTFNGLKNLEVLRLDHNKLEVLHGFEFVDLHGLRELYLNNNHLKHLSNVSFSPLRAIELLRIDNNLLTTFPVWNLALNPFLLEVSLYNNPWSCECGYLANLRAWLEANRIKATNAGMVRCQHNSTKTIGPPVLSDTPVRCDHYVATTRINSLIIHDYVMLLLITAAILLIVLASAVTVIAYRRRLRLWAVSRYGKRLFEKSTAYVEEREKLFDAFISHSAKDSTWVCGLMAPELEASGYRLCVAQRDCTAPSAPVAGRAIAESIACSRRVVIVLSRGLVDAEWCRYDFKSAHVDSLKNVKNRNIVIVALEDVPRSELDPELSSITRNASTTLQPRDPRFWEKLRRSMPTLRSRLRSGLAGTIGGKAASRPLVAAEHQNGPWPFQETKTSGHNTTKSLTVNPYWETAVGTNPSEVAWSSRTGPDLGAPPWLHSPTKQPPSPHPKDEERPDGSSPVGSGDAPEHTYMSVSEYNEVQASLLPSNNFTTLPGPNHIPNGNLPQVVNGTGGMRHPSAPSLFRRDAPDYLTRSWIFHPPPNEQPPPPGQTYFV
uniref:Toll4 n=1 Tax=Macrobrachium nipponense TaxID=159736 RepID=A0AAU7L1Z2_MACNP